MRKLYEVSMVLLSDKEDDLEIIKEAREYLNNYTDKQLFEYIEVYDCGSKIDYNKITLKKNGIGDVKKYEKKQ